MALRTPRNRLSAPYFRLRKNEDETIPTSELVRLAEAVQQIQSILAGGLSFGDLSNSSAAGNFKGQVIEYYFVVGGVNYSIPHGLRVRPKGYIVLMQDVAGSIVDVNFGAGWGTSYIQLQAQYNTIRAKLLLLA